MSIDLTAPFEMYWVGFRDMKSPPILNTSGWLRTFKSPYINACRVNSNTLKKMERNKMLKRIWPEFLRLQEHWVTPY